MCTSRSLAIFSRAVNTERCDEPLALHSSASVFCQSNREDVLGDLRAVRVKMDDELLNTMGYYSSLSSPLGLSAIEPFPPPLPHGTEAPQNKLSVQRTGGRIHSVLMVAADHSDMAKFALRRGKAHSPSRRGNLRAQLTDLRVNSCCSYSVCSASNSSKGRRRSR